MGRVCLHVGIVCPAYMIRPKGGRVGVDMIGFYESHALSP